MKVSALVVPFLLVVFLFTTSGSAQTTFPGSGMGAIPDSSSTRPRSYGPPLNVTFNVTGIRGGVGRVEVSFNASHAFVGDLKVTLIAPNGAQQKLFEATGAMSKTAAGSSNDLSSANTYTFRDSSANDWWTIAASANPIPTSNARTVVAGDFGVTDPPEATWLSAPFTGIAANGTWTLRFEDGGSGGTGIVTAANLTVTPLVPTDIDGPLGSGAFGSQVVVLPNGNIVVTDPVFDLNGVQDVGAVYLIDGETLGIISRLTGSTAGDQVGILGVTALTNGNYVVSSPYWNNGAATYAGAVTWGSGTTGVTGVVTAANSLVGSTAADQVGLWGVGALANGNFVVVSPHWHNSAATDAGAVTWGSGTSGVTGPVSAANSLVGSTADDSVGGGEFCGILGCSYFGAVAILANGNYVVGSPRWDNGATPDVGAVTWGNGATGITGVVSAANSLVGPKAGDFVGNRVAPLTNGNYVVSSPGWKDASVVPVGAATWGNGTTGITGVVSASNSLVGSTYGDYFNSGVTALVNGNYVVSSPSWDNGAATDAGAATWGNGISGITGVVSAANSLVGSTAGDQVGYQGNFQSYYFRGVTALTNGNYVVSSPLWDNGAATDAGAATWGNGTTGITGAVSVANSLVGSTAGDQLGKEGTNDYGGVEALTNGNYVVSSPAWVNGAATDAGAATWGNGTTGITGPVSASNSLVGSTAGDQVGYHSYGYRGVAALANGNYVVSSPSWDNGALTGAGAATWGNGTIGTTGPVSAANSLVGATADDYVGGHVTALTNGNYVVSSPNWDNGALTSAGAATWGNGTIGKTGPVSAANSLVGSTAGNQIGYVTALTNGNYIVYSPSWYNGATVKAGAVTLGNGYVGTTGPVTFANSVLGTAANDIGGFGFDAVRNTLYVGRRVSNAVTLLGPGLPALGPPPNRAPFDFDGDGKTDVSVFRPSEGMGYLNQSTLGFCAIRLGAASYQITPGDFDGDGKTNPAVFLPLAGVNPNAGFMVLNSSGSSMSFYLWGLPGDLPVPGDYDGDGRTDFAVWRPSNGVWFVRNAAATQWGMSDDKVVPGDYDGDGKTDIAVYRPSSGIWFINRSTEGSSAFQFGISTDKVVPADYDGDGRTDIAVYRDGVQGVWYLQQSTAGFTAMQFGTSGDVPVPGDYDGDGKTDIAVYRSGTWYINGSTTGFSAQVFGLSTDKPVPAAYVQ